ALDYLECISAINTLEGPPEAVFHFIEPATERRWTVQPNRGVLPWWVLRAGARVPDTRAIDYLGALRLRCSGPSAAVAGVLDREGSLFRRLWEPLAVAALNTGADRASAALFGRVLAETLGRGGA